MRVFVWVLEVGTENSDSLRQFRVEDGGLVRTWDNSELEQLIQRHLGSCLNVSFLLHSAALKYEVSKGRGRPTSGQVSAWLRACGSLLRKLRGEQTA